MFGVVCVKHINSVGKPINLFMSVLSGLCDLGVRESYSAFSKLMASKLELICIHKKRDMGVAGADETEKDKARQKAECCGRTGVFGRANGGRLCKCWTCLLVCKHKMSSILIVKR